MSGQQPHKLHGLDFGPYLNAGESPSTLLTEEQLRQRMQPLVPYTNWIRTYGTANGLDRAGAAARTVGLRIAMGAHISSSATANQAEMDRLVAAANRGDVDLAVIGNEVLLRGDLAPAALIELIRDFRRRVPTVPVTTSEAYNKLLEFPQVIQEVNTVLMHAYPMWEGYSLQTAIGVVDRRYKDVKALAGSKQVIVSETGWAGAGAAKGAAVMSPENAVSYLLAFVSWARANDVQYFYFEAYDEPWKAAEEDVGPYFGLFTPTGIPKEGVAAVFENLTVPDSWSGSAPVGTGGPSIELTYVPPFGLVFDTAKRLIYENLPAFVHGTVRGAAPDACKVGLYIKVADRWYVKPYADARREIEILADGTWRGSYTTPGGTGDANATEIDARLFCGTGVPVVFDAASLPFEVTSRPGAARTRTAASISGRSVSGATMQLSGFLTRSSLAAPGGYYSFPDINDQRNYTVTPSMAGVVFTPGSRDVVNLAPNGIRNADFTGAPEPLSAPRVVAPVPSSTVAVPGITFQWNSVPGATGYDLIVHDRSVNRTVFTGNLAGAASTTTLISLPNGDFRFLVRPCSGGFRGSQCGAFASVLFAVRAAVPGPGAPSVVSPAAGQMLTESTATLRWTEVPGSQRYEVLVRDTATGRVELNISTPELSTIHSFRGSLTYGISVRACSAACGGWPAERPFSVKLPPKPTTAPTVTVLPQGADTTAISVTFTQVPGADLYQVQAVQSNTGPGGGALTVAAKQASWETVRLPVPAGPMGVVVAACNGDGCGPNSAAVNVTSAGPNPTLPGIGTPMAGADSGNPVLFTWTRVAGDTGTNVRYRLYVQDLSRQSAALDVFTTQNFWSAHFRPGVRYDALAIADVAGQIRQGPASGFVVRGSNPPKPVMVQPALNSTVPAGNTFLAWTPIDGATLYQYYVSANGNVEPWARGVTPGLTVQVPLSPSVGPPHSATARACLIPVCEANSDTGWSEWAGATNFLVAP